MASLLMAGCTAAPGSDAAGAPEVAAWPSGERTGLVKGLVLPLEYYMVAHPDRVATETVYRNAVEDCMAGFGFRMPAVQRGSAPPSVNAANMERRYGISDPEAAARHGYRQPSAQAERPPSDGLPGGEAAALVLDGAPDGDSAEHDGVRIPEGGCAGEAERRVGRVDDFLASQLSMRSMAESDADPGVRKAQGEWSACMAEKGYAVAHPHEASGLLPRLTDRPTEEEITLALADIGCKESTNLVQRWFRVEVELQNTYIEENFTALEETRDRNIALIAEAGSR
ncbi:hypothetical protein [Streptomyces sp. YIM 98790]|uniref:hypothetical protein n=1 Tax=Streptomyces sp. YIM 98790 TaxID=2689077 RepID=UPI0014082204|nr:hypothetical protein [Streptomyces sp. YIM 98790]